MLLYIVLWTPRAVDERSVEPVELTPHNVEQRDSEKRIRRLVPNGCARKAAPETWSRVPTTPEYRPGDAVRSSERGVSCVFVASSRL